MKNIAMSLLVLIMSGTTMAQTKSGSSSDESRSVTMHDLDKTLEVCRELHEKLNCPEAAKACAGEKSFEDKKACLQRQAK